MSVDTSPSPKHVRDEISYGGWKAALSRGEARSLIGVFAVFAILVFAAGFVSSSLTPLALTKTLLSLSVFVIIVGFGQFIVVITGGLDLSVPGVMTFAAVILTAESGGSNGKAMFLVPAILLLGALVGFISGIVTVASGVSPVVVTLALNVMIGGAVLAYTNGTPSGSVPSAVVWVTKTKLWGGIPLVGVLTLGFVVVVTLLINKSTFGRQLYAIGNNPRAAFLMGVPVKRVTVMAYMISGACAALGGMLLAGYSGQSYLTLGDPYLLLSIAAVILGGVSITGGRGSYVAVVGGSLILIAINVILAATSLPSAFRQIIYAVVILVAVIAARQESSR